MTEGPEVRSECEIWAQATNWLQASRDGLYVKRRPFPQEREKSFAVIRFLFWIALMKQVEKILCQRQGPPPHGQNRKMRVWFTRAWCRTARDGRRTNKNHADSMTIFEDEDFKK